ncbi:MMPL family transporter [Jatrophihabitans sp. YIM 134969]
MHPERTTPARRTVPVRLARWSATHRLRAIALWLVFVAACVTVGQVAGLHEATEVDTSVGQSGQALRWLHDAGLTAPDTEDVLVTARSGDLDAATAAGVARQVRTAMTATPGVAAVSPPVTSPDGSAVVVGVTLRTGADVAALQAVTTTVQRDHPELRIEQAGSESVNAAVEDQVASDLSSAGVISLPVTLLILLVAFGAVVAAGVPVLLALSAVGAGTGLSALASHVVPDSGSTSSVILLMGMAVGVDYSLFYVKRVRAERRAGRSTLDAVDIAAETSGHSVLVSGFAVVIAMLGLYVSGNLVFASLATGAVIVVAVAVLGSLTVLPALLVVLGRAIDRPRVPVLWRLTATRREPVLWNRVLRPSLAHPGRTLAVSAGALALVALPALGMRLSSGSVQSLPDSIAQKHTLERLTTAFPDRNSGVDVVVRAPAGARDEVREALLAVGATAGRDPHFVAGGTPTVAVSTSGTTQYLQLVMPFDEESPDAAAGIDLLRSTLVPDAVHDVPGARFAVGGDAASAVDADHQLSSRLPWVIATVVVLTVLLTAFVFRSLVLALCTAGMNLLSAGAAFGLLTLVFQHHWADGLFGYESTGALVNWIPLFTFTVLFGLSMDYHVFVVNSIREETARGRSVREAVRVGVGRSAGTVTAAAVVMVSVFAIFAGLHMVEMKQLGVGLAAAVLLDAVVVRAVVLPSLLVLLGDRIRWPGRTIPVAAAPEPRELAAAR